MSTKRNMSYAEFSQASAELNTEFHNEVAGKGFTQEQLNAISARYAEKQKRLRDYAEGRTDAYDD